MSEFDNLVNASHNGASKPTNMFNFGGDSLLLKVSKIAIYIAFGLLVISGGFLIAALGAYGSSASTYYALCAGAFAGGASLLFYGLIGECLDNIRTLLKSK